MISYIYMLLITVVCFLWQGIAREQVDFFKRASEYTSVSMKYDYLYTALKKAKEICAESSTGARTGSGCSTGAEIKIDGYKYPHKAKVCKDGSNVYFAFFTAPVLTEKPPVSLPSDISLIKASDIPRTCSVGSGSDTDSNNERIYALKSKNGT